jgi:hypothetical protein
MLTTDQIDQILHAACSLRPGTAWNMRGNVLEQAIDDKPRVTVPSQEEIENFLANQERA